MSNPHKAVPLVAPGHTRPITHLSFSPLLDDGTYLLISSCKDGNPMLREWTGDWIGTFVGHKGAVWCTKLSHDGSRAASGSADFTACVFLSYCAYVQTVCSSTHPQTLCLLQQDLGYIQRTVASLLPSQSHRPQCRDLPNPSAHRRTREEGPNIRHRETGCGARCPI